jgi:hypothetical protein
MRHPLSAAILLVAVALTAGVLTLARPQYHPHTGKSFDLSYVTLPAHGWVWRGGTPGFRFGQDEEVWNDSRLPLRRDDLAGARDAARAAGVDPASVRVLRVVRVGPHEGTDAFALLAGSGGGRTCIGAVLPRRPVSFSCDLARRVSLFVAAPLPAERDPKYGRLYPLYGVGVVRADVQRVTLEIAGLQHATLYDRGSAFAAQATPWGTFALQSAFPRPWRGTLRFYGRHGLLAALPLASRHPRERVVAVG